MQVFTLENSCFSLNVYTIGAGSHYKVPTITVYTEGHLLSADLNKQTRKIKNWKIRFNHLLLVTFLTVYFRFAQISFKYTHKYNTTII